MNKEISCITGGRIILENEIIDNKAIVFDNKIIDILDKDIFKQKYDSKKIALIEAEGKYISPGFIDVHIHGCGGSDVMDADISALKTISYTMAKGGTTSFLATTMTLHKENIYQALNSVRDAMKENIKGAKILGAYLEGPFLSADYTGVHKKEYILKPDFEFIKYFLDVIKIITIAPEEDAGFEFIKQVKKSSDVILSIGHTNADYNTAAKSIKAGVNCATHIFNAMRGLHHREPGPAGAIIKAGISYELIADTVHVHPAFFQMLLDCKGKDKMVLITDSNRAAYMKEGIWELGGRKVIVKNNCARTEDGSLAGSVLAMNKAVLNILKHTDLKINEAVNLASINPARLIGIDKTKGSLAARKDADMIVFDDKLNVSLSISEGDIIYKA